MQVTVYDTIINNLNDRFHKRDSVKVAKNIEELLLAGVRGEYDNFFELKKGIGFKTYQSAIDEQLLFSEFHYVSGIIDLQNVTSLHTLIKEVQKCGTDILWLVGKNFMNLFKISLCLMPTNISAERVFSTLDRIKTRLRNRMTDERLNNLVICSTYPEMVESVSLVNLCNAFVENTEKMKIRKNHFGKFTLKDFDCQEKSSECDSQNDSQEAGKSTYSNESVVGV